jgi:hypothetical protein
MKVRGAINMKNKFKLTKEERWIEDHAEEFVPVTGEEFNRIKEALERKKKEIQDMKGVSKFSTYLKKELKDKEFREAFKKDEGHANLLIRPRKHR